MSFHFKIFHFFLAENNTVYFSSVTEENFAITNPSYNSLFSSKSLNCFVKKEHLRSSLLNEVSSCTFSLSQEKNLRYVKSVAWRTEKDTILPLLFFVYLSIKVIDIELLLFIFWTMIYSESLNTFIDF